MTRKELIEDGWIDKYVLGLTSEPESNEIERLASLYPEIQDQINSARNRLCGKFNRNLTQPALRHSLLTKRRVLLGSALAVTTVLLGFALLCGEHFSLKKDYHSQCDKLAREQAKVNQMASFYRVASERSNFLNSINTKRIKLKGCDATPDAEVVVFRCRISGKMMLQVIDLPELPSGHHYEVWAQSENLIDRVIGKLIPPIRYDSLYVLDTAIHSTSLQITAMDPVSHLSEPVCLADIK